MRGLEKHGITGVVSLSGDHHMHGAGTVQHSTCLLYTSDAADERSSVDLGGRRLIKKKIIKKKKQQLTKKEKTL